MWAGTPAVVLGAPPEEGVSEPQALSPSASAATRARAVQRRTSCTFLINVFGPVETGC